MAMAKNGSRRTFRGRLKSLWRRIWVTLNKLAREKAPPERVALGLALGIFIGFLPIMGIQMAVVSLVALPFRANIKAGIVGVWISNPVTFIPLYYANYNFGLLFLPQEGASKEVFVSAITAASDFSWSALWKSMIALFDMGSEILIPLWLGSAILGVLFGVPTYFVTKRAVIKYRERRARKKAKQAEETNAS